MKPFLPAGQCQRLPRGARRGIANPPLTRAARDEVLQRIKSERRYWWRTSSGATRHSLGENAISRFKGLEGFKLAARRLANLQVEAMVKCQVLNRMASLGLSVSERIPAT